MSIEFNEIGKDEKGQRPPIDYDTADRTNRRGPLSKEEEHFIESNYEHLSDADMGTQLGRSEVQVRNHRIKYLSRPKLADGRIKKTDEESVAEEIKRAKALLKKRPEWVYWKQQFSQDEIGYFIYQYARLTQQFNNDILATEEKQIFTAIELDIFIQRNKRERRRSIEERERLQARLTEELEKDDADKVLVQSLQNEINLILGSEAGRTTEYKTLLEKHDGILKAMKSTREQRLQRIENKSFIGYLKQLEDQEIREAEGREIELRRMAMEKEMERLRKTYTYDDGSQDNPLLYRDSEDEEITMDDITNMGDDDE